MIRRFDVTRELDATSDPVEISRFYRKQRKMLGLEEGEEEEEEWLKTISYQFIFLSSIPMPSTDSPY